MDIDVREVRSKLKLSQEKFAQLMGVTLGSVARWEKGSVKPSPLAIERLKVIVEGLDEQKK